MTLFSWLRTFFQSSIVGEQQPPAAVEHALSLLAEVGVASARLHSVRRFAVSPDSNYCALTMTNYESYAVDIKERRYLHYPTAGVTAFNGSSLVLSPDEERFSLEPSGHESFEVDLRSELLHWQGLGSTGGAEAPASNLSIERTCPGKPGHAAHVKR